MNSKTTSTATKLGGSSTFTPKRRFPEFQHAPAWEPVSLRKASVPVDQRVGERKLTPVSISAGIGFVPQAEKFGRDISGNQYQLYTLVRDGDFVFNKGNSLKFPQGCIYLLEGWGRVAAPNVFIAFRLKEGYSNGFFQNCFEQNQHGKQLKRHITSGARSNGLLNISKDTFFGVEIPTPSLFEQEKIADCLASADALIEAQARKVEALRAHKRGLMQQLFPQEGETQPRLRFPQFETAGDWEEIPLSALVSALNAGVSVDSGDRPAMSHEIGVLKTSAVKNGIFKPLENKVVFDDEEVNRVREPVRADTIIISRMNTPALVGANAYVKDDCPNIFLPDRLWAAKPRSGTYMRFVALMLGSDMGRASLSNLAGGSSGSMKNISKPRVLELLVMAPSLPEQQRIADCLTSLDDLIAAETQKLNTLRTHKKGLMQQLFPTVEGDDV
ncbi:restriction endonuclease subunit S [Microvirga antarctica]|uniref:restriction endonuclease subunit S n=1 Tax=Microvirga antarctica TaxID=2819233 RepID=UPI001B300CB1|nr:restriction endonuclease subunit S [Microvirga antarctica]